MRAHRYFTVILAAVFCLGMLFPVGMRGMGASLSGSAPVDRDGAAADFSDDESLPHQTLADAPGLSRNAADPPTADRRDADAGRISLPRLSQLPRAACDAAVDAGSVGGGRQCPCGGRLPEDDRPHFSQTLVIEHVRLQI